MHELYEPIPFRHAQDLPDLISVRGVIVLEPTGVKAMGDSIVTAPQMRFMVIMPPSSLPNRWSFAQNTAKQDRTLLFMNLRYNVESDIFENGNLSVMQPKSHCYEFIPVG